MKKTLLALSFSSLFFGSTLPNKVPQTIEKYGTLNTDKIPTHIKNRIEKYKPIILKVAQKTEVDPHLLVAVIWTESHFNNRARSYIGAVGLMQLTRPTSRYICYKLLQNNKSSCQFADFKGFADEFTKNPERNIHYGATYLKYLLEKFDYQKRLATLAYNEGPGRIQRLKEKILSNEVFNDHQYYKKVEDRYELIASL